MTDAPARLLAEMKAHVEDWEGDEDPDLATAYGGRARAVGERELLVHLFRTHADSELGVWLGLLAFAWRDVPYATWLEILEELAGDRRHVHQFLWFASETLGLDVHRLPVPHSNVRIELDGETFRDGGPHPISPARRARMEDPLDYEAMWRRLAGEGAPMRASPPGSSDRHVIVT